ncbi:restriction endonuclease subunit S [Glaesserella parasuis]|uniref:restriction endonuclease subunit S n=1 Tax=Glaesserella parasuis TaxID=738 RepID=UPI002725BD40|nr:restriction endonuclease subunit S [Glaesserella parasuis]
MAFNISELDFIFPNDWKLVRLGDIAKINAGSITKKDKFDFIKYIDISSVSTHSFQKPNILNFNDAPSRARRKLKDNDFIISTVRPNLRQYAFLNKVEENWIASTGFCVVSADNETLAWYLYSLVTSEIFTNYLVRVADGGAYPAFNPKEIEDAIIPLPNPNDLKIISSLAKDIYHKIELNTQINQTLEQIAQTIFKSWFIDFDPVHAKANALASGQTAEQATQVAMAVISGKNTQELHRLQTANPKQYQQLWEIAETFPSGFDEEGVPRGWESKSLDEIAIYQNGLALQKFRPESEDEYLPVVKIAQLKQGYADGKEKASVNIKPECIIDNGDVIFSWSGSLVVDIWCGGKAALNQHLFKVTSKNYPKWLYYFYTVHHLAEFQRIAADKAVTMGHIKREHLSLALCVIPNNEFIQKFCFLEDYISQIVNNRLQNVSLIKIRDELLPKLLSGEI